MAEIIQTGLAGFPGQSRVVYSGSGQVVLQQAGGSGRQLLKSGADRSDDRDGGLSVQGSEKRGGGAAESENSCVGSIVLFLKQFKELCVDAQQDLRQITVDSGKGPVPGF